MMGDAELAVDRDGHPPVSHRVVVALDIQRRERHTGVSVGPGRSLRPRQRSLADRCVEAAARHDGVDEAPVDGLLALDPFGPGGEDVGEIPADVALVDQPRQPARAGQHGEQRHLRQRDGGRTVVDEDDLVARQRQLVATAGRCAVDGSDPRLPGLGRGVLDGVARLVGELAEVDLVAVGGAGEHLDVGAGAEDPCSLGTAETRVDAAGDDDRLHARVLEAQPLRGVVELDVDAEVVAVELQLVAVAEPSVGRYAHRQRGDRSVDGEVPMPVAARVGCERDRSHDVPPSGWQAYVGANR